MPKKPVAARPPRGGASTPAQPAALPKNYRVDVVLTRAEITALGDDGRPSGRQATTEIPIFACDFGLTVREFLLRHGLKKEAL